MMDAEFLSMWVPHDDRHLSAIDISSMSGKTFKENWILLSINILKIESRSSIGWIWYNIIYYLIIWTILSRNYVMIWVV
jgi:hypothetical protein